MEGKEDEMHQNLKNRRRRDKTKKEKESRVENKGNTGIKKTSYTKSSILLKTRQE